MARYHVENFGCRTSQADGDTIAAQLEALGTERAEGLPQADVVVVNTCTVTAEADRSARAFIRRAQRANPDSRIVVTGCYAQRVSREIADLPGIYAVVGNSHKAQVASIAVGSPIRSHDFVPLTSMQSSVPIEAFRPLLLSGDIFAHSDFQLPSFSNSIAHRTRPSLKIQDGCDNRCIFCVIPSIRGNSRSLRSEKVLQAVQEFVIAGGTELVISGINLGRWGRDLVPQSRLEDLLAEILETTALTRLRISSVEPMDWTDGLIALFARWGTGEYPNPRLARHAHIPLQSGSDSVLRRMHRRYRPWHYAQRSAAIREASPEAAIGADVMVGFPGETQDEFQQSYDFIAAQPLTYLHLFPFSARPGTPAWELHRQSPVSGIAVRERMAALRTLIDSKNLAFRSQFVGKTLSAVTLLPAAEQRGCALSDNFVPIEIDDFCAPNTLVSIRITGVASYGLGGTHSMNSIGDLSPRSRQRA